MPAIARTPGETDKIGKPTAVKTALTAWTIDRDVEDAKSASVKYVCKFKKTCKIRATSVNSQEYKWNIEILFSICGS
jgi:hypothetical protein